METIVINGKRFVIRKFKNHHNNYNLCNKCLFYHNSKYHNPSYHCVMTKCYDFIVIREVNVIDKIKMWFKKKDKEVNEKAIN